jgi:hypothetical protein
MNVIVTIRRKCMRYRITYYHAISGGVKVERRFLHTIKPGSKAFNACLRAEVEGFAIEPFSEYGDVAVIQKMKWWELW